MSENFLTDQKLYELLTQEPPLKKEVALNFIQRYGDERAISALTQARKEQGGITMLGLDQAEWDTRFENINNSLNQLLLTLVEACS
jgi:hypothetical protein